MSSVLLNIIHIGVFVSSFNLVECEVFTAVTDLETLVNTHENVISKLKQYIEVEENRLNVLKRYLKLFTDEHEKMRSDINEYVDNPINAFTLIKRLSTDFERLKTVASEPTEFVWDQEMLYPTEEDLIGSAVAIARLQFVYKLNTTQLAEGNLQGVLSSPMTASDCYNLALMLYKKEGLYTRAAEWFKAALGKLNNEQNENTLTIADVMSYIVKSYHHSNIYLDPEAYEWAEKLHALKPDISTDPVLKLYKRATEQNMNDDVDDTNVDLWNAYSTLCRGEDDVHTANTSKLHCSYLRNIPFLKLAPIKMEEVHKNPNIFIFYDVLSDDDFQIIKTNAGPKLKRAGVSGITHSENRIGKNTWLENNIDAVAKLRQRTADFTGLSMSHAELLQVLNYGIGGHYLWHYDAYYSSEFSDDVGQRIATVLFYMTDVSQGGATVFAYLNLTVTPKKGSALFWENLHPSGEIDQRTLHASCPVIYGSKWVSNLWIHEAGQELLRPCPVI